MYLWSGFGVILAGYSSASKWALFGAMREAAQVVSYEVPLGMCAVVPVMLAGSMDPVYLCDRQAGWFVNWYMFYDPFTFIVFWIYVTCATASVNRAPFDLAEAESELVAGFHTEYSGLRWSFFFMAEYGSMLAVSLLASILFMGGWHGPIPVASLIGLTEGGWLMETWVALDDPVTSSDPEYSALVASADPADWTGRRIDPEDLYCLLYTSGTTGRPKGVMIPHRMVAWNGLNTVASWQLREDDVSPIFTPLYHAGGLMAFLVPLVTIGGTIVLHQGFDTSQIWKTIESERCSVVLGVPTIWKMLLEAPEFATVDLRHVRAFFSGGAPLPSFIIDAYQKKGVVFKQGFGMTEVGVNCFAMTVEDSFRKAGSIGKPMMFTEVRLVDEEGKDVPKGEVGELLFRGPHVSKGYWHNPEATSAALDADGWFHSGDLARCDEEGYYYVAGRRKDMIISGGVNVYPAEIETELLQHEAIEDVAVVGVPDPKWGEMGVAFVVPLPGKEIAPHTLIEHLESRLAKFKIPKVFRIVETLPRTAYGKVVKGELRELYLKEGG